MWDDVEIKKNLPPFSCVESKKLLELDVYLPFLQPRNDQVSSQELFDLLAPSRARKLVHGSS